jgi:hypothetical protein
MDVSIPLVVAAIGGVVTLGGAVVSNILERRKTLSQQKIEFRYEQYKEFLASFCQMASNQRREDQLRFSVAANGALLLGSQSVVESIRDLVLNYENSGGFERQQSIVEQIIFHMRSDLEAPDQHALRDFKFPFVVPDIGEESMDAGDEASGDNRLESSIALDPSPDAT